MAYTDQITAYQEAVKFLQGRRDNMRRAALGNTQATEVIELVDNYFSPGAWNRPEAARAVGRFLATSDIKWHSVLNPPSLFADPRTAEYASIVACTTELEKWRLSDAEVGAHEAYKVLSLADVRLGDSTIRDIVDNWPEWLRTPSGSPIPRDPGCGTGHREW